MRDKLCFEIIFDDVVRHRKKKQTQDEMFEDHVISKEN